MSLIKEELYYYFNTKLYYVKNLSLYSSLFFYLCFFFLIFILS